MKNVSKITQKTCYLILILDNSRKKQKVVRHKILANNSTENKNKLQKGTLVYSIYSLVPNNCVAQINVQEEKLPQIR